MQVALLMELLEPNNNLSEYFGCFLEGEDPVFKFSLIVDEISPVAILQNKIDALLVFGHIVQLNNILRIHGLHALDLPIQILSKVGLILNHFHRNQFQSQQLSLLILDQVDVTICPLSQSTLILVFIQKHKRYYKKSNLTH
jgi:hypothetical protein